MKCVYCGAQLRKGSVYCANCGKETQVVPDYNGFEDDYLKALLEDATSEEAALAKETIAKVQKEKVQTAKKKKEEQLQKAKIRKIVLLSILIVLCIVLAVIIFYTKTNITQEQNNSYDYQIQLGVAAQQENDLEHAITYYQKAITLNPDETKARSQLADIYYNQGDFEAASAICRELIVLEPSNIDAYRMLISIYAKSNQTEEIIALSKTVSDEQILELFSDYIVEAPIFSYDSGTYEEYIKVELAATGVYNIYYTTDGSDPVTDGKLYTKAIAFNDPGDYTIRAVCLNIKGIYSEVAEGQYHIEIPAPDMPDVNPNGGNFTSETEIRIEVPKGCSAYYTWDGSNPTSESEVYAKPLVIPEGNNVLSVIVIDNKTGLSSNIYRQYYTYYPS